MLLGRVNEIKYLDNLYQREGSSLVVLYGRKGCGKSAILREFTKDKACDYFTALETSADELCRMWALEKECSSSFEAVFQKSMEQHCRKKIIVIEDFQNAVKTSDDFMTQIVKLLHTSWNNKSCMIILVSSHFFWVENSMVSLIGDAAYEISGFLKIKELTFLDLVRRFEKYSFRDALGVYSILGGMPMLWEHFDDSKTLKQNICDTILNKKSLLHYWAENEITQKLRESVVYNTILTRLAMGEDKLNDIYVSTGFSRAKISVYMKNLMELEIVEKIYSVATEGHDNARKGIYRIKNNLIDFYFRFVFPRLHKLDEMSSEEFYDEYIDGLLESYQAPYFKDVCREFMTLKARSGALPVKVEEIGSWSGKMGDIDILGISSDGKVVSGICCWDKSEVRYDDYEWLLYCLKMAKLKDDYIFIFSGGTFEQKLIDFAKDRDNIVLIDEKEL